MDEPPSLVLLNPFLSLLVAISAVVLMLICALVAIAETAFFSLTPDTVAQWSKSINQRKRTVAMLMRDLLRLRITLLFTVALSKVAIVVIWFFVFREILLNSFEAVLFIALTSTALILICDVIPRLYAKKHGHRYVENLSSLVRVLVMLCSPAVTIAIQLRDKWRNTFQDKKPIREELTEALEMAAANDPVVENERDILRGIVNFGSLTAGKLMKPRDAISAIPLDASFSELINHINRCGFSRIPVFKRNLDTIVGVIYVKDLLPFLDNNAGFSWPSILRPGFFITESKKIDLLLKDFQEKRVHMAIVKDEFGKTSGLITLENLIEEIIAGINDESDEIENAGYRRIDDNTFVFDGRTPIQEFFRVLDQDYPFFREAGDHESLEDFIIEFNDDLPNPGDELYYEQFTFVIEAIEQKRIKRVRVNIHAQA